jgi:hypothetical protein
MHRPQAAGFWKCPSIAASNQTTYIPKWRSMMMLGQISYGLFSAVLAGLMQVASVRDKQDRPNAAAAMLSARVN